MVEHNHPAGCVACDELLARENAARTTAEVANRAKDDFFLTLSHELRGPLNAILSWVYLLRTGKLDEATAARALETIERNAQAEGRLIGDMLDVARIAGGKVRLALAPVNLAALIAESVETVRPETDKGAIRVEIDSPHPIDSVTADPDRLRQVMENLLLNAVKYCATRRRRAACNDRRMRHRSGYSFGLSPPCLRAVPTERCHRHAARRARTRAHDRGAPRHIARRCH